MWILLRNWYYSGASAQIKNNNVSGKQWNETELQLWTYQCSLCGYGLAKQYRFYVLLSGNVKIKITSLMYLSTDKLSQHCCAYLDYSNPFLESRWKSSSLRERLSCVQHPHNNIHVFINTDFMFQVTHWNSILQSDSFALETKYISQSSFGLPRLRHV